MGLFGPSDPISRRDYQRHELASQRDANRHEHRMLRESIRADERAMDREERRAERAEREEQRAAEAAAKRRTQALAAAARAEEKAWSKTVSRWSGGTSDSDPHAADPWLVSHFATKLPPTIVPPHGASGPRLVPHARFLVMRDPELRDDATWLKEKGRPADARAAEIEARYGSLLSSLRDPSWWRSVCASEVKGAPQVATVTEKEESWKSAHAAGTRTVRYVELPSIERVWVAEDGLRIRLQQSPGGLQRWTKALEHVRSAMKAVGAPASRLRVFEDASARVVLALDDAPSSFPAAVCLEPPTATAPTVADAVHRYDRTEWMLGVDARGGVVSFGLAAQPHVLVTGGTGGGKSVWVRSVVEMLRTGYRTEDGHDAGGGWLCFIGDGKSTDYAALRTRPGVAMVAPGSDPAQIAVMVRRVRLEVERRFAEASEKVARGDTDAFAHMQPWLLALDEWGTTIIRLEKLYGKVQAEAFTSDIDIILRLGRECRVHCMLASQTIRKTGDGAVPGSWQENLGLTVSLGAPSEITLQSDAFTEDSRPRARSLGARLKGKQGRGLTVNLETDAVVEFQAFYGWSPGTTSLDADAAARVRPPSDSVRRVWERWAPVSDSVPWLAPRVGIQARDAQWRTGALDDVADTPVVALTDRSGIVKSELRQFDPADPSWLGKAAVGSGAPALAFEDEAPPAPAPSTPTPAPTVADPGLTPTEMAAVAELLAKLRATPTPEPEQPEAPEPEPLSSDSGAIVTVSEPETEAPDTTPKPAKFSPNDASDF